MSHTLQTKIQSAYVAASVSSDRDMADRASVQELKGMLWRIDYVRGVLNKRLKSRRAGKVEVSV